MTVIPVEIVDAVEKKTGNAFFEQLTKMNAEECETVVEGLIKTLHDGIDDKKRISYGITYVIKILSKINYQNADYPYEIGLFLYRNMKGFRSKCVGLGVLSHIGVANPDEILPILAKAATDEQCEIKEFVQMFVRKITKKHPQKVQEYLMELAVDESPDKRRFASECLRPVAENRWINDDPEFSLTVLRLLFKESDEFPRVSVGNNLSDLSRKNPELIFGIVQELMNLNDENAAFIAHRACRNLVIKEPIRVMDLLKCDEYRYKNRVYKRNQIL